LKSSYKDLSKTNAIKNLNQLNRKDTIKLLLNIYDKDKKKSNFKKGLFDIITSSLNLKQALLEIKPYNSRLYFNDINIEELSLKLKTNSYKYKSNSSNSTGSLKDKLIQQAFYRVLEIIFEGVQIKKEISFEDFKKVEPGFNTKFKRNNKYFCNK